jgi:membrane protein YqaA with SNARE-associated domain
MYSSAEEIFDWWMDIVTTSTMLPDWINPDSSQILRANHQMNIKQSRGLKVLIVALPFVGILIPTILNITRFSWVDLIAIVVITVCLLTSIVIWKKT